MKNFVINKAYTFSVNAVLESKYIQKTEKEFILTKQLIRCSTSIGANITEAQAAESRKDFIHKMKIAHKEALESRYWLNFLKDTNCLSKEKSVVLIYQITEIIKMIVAIINSTRINLKSEF